MTLRTKVLLPPLLTGLVLMVLFEWCDYRLNAGTGYRLLGGLGIVAAVALAWNRISWRLIATDIRGLRRQVNDIALGTWVRRTPAPRTDEIGSVATALDEMGAKLQETTAQFAAASQLAATALVGERLLRSVNTTEEHIRSIANILAEARNSQATVPDSALHNLATAAVHLGNLRTEFEREFARQFRQHAWPPPNIEQGGRRFTALPAAVAPSEFRTSPYGRSAYDGSSPDSGRRASGSN